MQILLLGLFLAIYLHDATAQVPTTSADGTTRWGEALPTDSWPYLEPLPVLALVLLPKILLGVTYWLACRRTYKRLGKPKGHKAYRSTERFTSALPVAALLLFGCDLLMGALRTARVAFQHTVVVDEIMVLLPTLGLIIFCWWAYYPIDRRMREAAIMRLADQGHPIYPLWTRGDYVVSQIRHQLLLLLLPLTAVLAWSESVILLGPSHRALLSASQIAWVSPLGSLGIFLLAPLVVRYAWDTVPLPAGEIRDRMIQLCQREKVRVRQLLLWRTHGGMVNAAVAGLIAPLRFILLSDALLDQVDRRAIEGVMAHELAHARKHHIFWMLFVLIVTLGAIEQLMLLLLAAIEESISPWSTGVVRQAIQDPDTQTYIIALPAFAITMLVFGWVSRRIERQADVFAARYLAQTTDSPEKNEIGKPIFDATSVGTMIRALQRVADLNHIPVMRKSWRHGSIAWRQDHLRSLIGKPIDRPEIDLVIGRIKAAALTGAILIALAYFWQYTESGESTPAQPTPASTSPAIIPDSL